MAVIILLVARKCQIFLDFLMNLRFLVRKSLSLYTQLYVYILCPFQFNFRPLRNSRNPLVIQN